MSNTTPPLPPHAQATVYAHAIHYSAPVGRVNSTNYQECFLSLVSDMDRLLRRRDPWVVAMAEELLQFERDNPAWASVEAEIIEASRKAARAKGEKQGSTKPSKVRPLLSESRPRAKAITPSPSKLSPIPCDQCGVEFTPKNAQGRFCGKPCSNAYHQAKQMEKNRAKSLGTRTETGKILYDRTCVICGTGFQIGRAWARYCSAGCGAIGRENLRRVRLANLSTKPPVFNCLTCGNAFDPGNYAAKFCSAPCYRASRNARRREGQLATPTVCNCLVCGESFRPGSHTARYCSHSCANAARSENRRNRNEQKKLAEVGA